VSRFRCSEAAGGSDPHEGDAGLGRQELRRRVPYERLAARSGDHVVEGKQADQEDVPDRKCAVYVYVCVCVCVYVCVWVCVCIRVCINIRALKRRYRDRLASLRGIRRAECKHSRLFSRETKQHSRAFYYSRTARFVISHSARRKKSR